MSDWKYGDPFGADGTNVPPWDGTGIPLPVDENGWPDVPDDQRLLRITSPKDGDEVSPYAPIVGRGAQPGGQVDLYMDSYKGGDTPVDTVTAKSDGTFRFIGRVPMQASPEGIRVGEGENVRSVKVTVTLKDDAPTYDVTLTAPETAEAKAATVSGTLFDVVIDNGGTALTDETETFTFRWSDGTDAVDGDVTVDVKDDGDSQWTTLTSTVSDGAVIATRQVSVDAGASLTTSVRLTIASEGEMTMTTAFADQATETVVTVGPPPVTVTLTGEVDPTEATVGDTITVTFTLDPEDALGNGDISVSASGVPSGQITQPETGENVATIDTAGLAASEYAVNAIFLTADAYKYTSTSTVVVGEFTLTDAVAEPGFDPGDHTVAEVQAYLADHPEETDAVLTAERAGKARITLIGE